MTISPSVPSTAVMTPAALYNGYVGAHVFWALHELGVLDRWGQGVTRIDELAPGTDPDRLAALLAALDRLGFVEVAGGAARLTATGADLHSQQGFFTWCVGGHGELWRRLAGLTTGELRFGSDVRRDGARVALGCAEADRSLMLPVQDDVLSGVDFRSVVDIGCGDGSRLLRLCEQRPDRTGVGIDLSPDALALGRRAAEDKGLTGRAEFVEADVFELLGSGRTFPGVELVISIFMLHDLFAATDDHSALVRALQAVFPDARYFLLADTAAQQGADRQGPPPVFSLGFELAHAFMGVRLQPREAYEQAFVAGGLTILRREPFGAPSTWLYLLETKRRTTGTEISQ